MQSRNFSELDLDSLKFDENKSRATFIKEGDRLVLKEYHIEGSGNIAYVLQQQQGSATIWISSTYEDINISNATYNYTQVVKWEVQGYYSSEQKITASGVVEDDGRIKAQKVTTEENKNFDQPQGGFKYTKLIEKETKELQEDGKFLETAKTVTFEKENGDKIEITYAYYKNGKPQRREITETSGGVTATRTEIVESGSFESGKIKISGKWINPSTGKVEEIGEKTVTRSSTQLTAELAKQLGLPEDLVGSLIAIDLSNEFTVGQASQEELDEIKKALFIAYLVTQVGLKIESEEDMKKLDSAYQALMSGDIDGALNALGLSLNEQQKAALIKILEEIKNNLSGTEINNVKVQEQVIYDAKTGKIIKRSYKYVSGLPPLKTTQQQTQNANQGPTAQGTASTGPGGGAGPSKVSEDTNLPSTGMRSPGERAKREINSALSNFRKIAAKGNVEEILNYLREQGFVDSLSQVHIGKLSRFKNQRVARGYKLAQTVMQKFKEILKTQGKEKAKAYLKKLGLSDAVIEKVFGSADNPMSEEEAIKRAQAVLMGATDEEIEKVAKGELSLEELAKKYKLPDSVVEKIMNLTDATEAWGILLLNVKDETGNLALENVETIQNILNILEEEKPSEDKYNEISQIMQEVLELSESEVQELIGSSPAQLLQSTLYKYDQKQAALDYFKQETGFSDFTAQLITTG
ncbi:MAG: hypothetical protein NC821_06550, partial [Candidatus Omnitrophica bacterium]|nr:hypothetical protein [Candidatus Omnitrophota bacterium]